MDRGGGFEIGAVIYLVFAVCVIAVPLAIWKAIEFLIWFFSHLQWVS
jgi:hypothetical protein